MAARRRVGYRLLVGTDIDAGSLDLFAHPPLVRVGSGSSETEPTK